jgi:acetyltransferase-like isoleucine patch superfamily enzyme
MSNSLIGHDTKVGPLCHFSVGSITSSYVEIGKVSDVTLGAKVLEKKKIGNYAVAGASSLVTKDIPDGEIHVGIPAKFLKKVSKE